MKELLQKPVSKRKIRVAEILKTVADCSGVNHLDILADTRGDAFVVAARVIAVGISKELTDYSVDELGILFNRVNLHTTVKAYSKYKVSKIYMPLIKRVHSQLTH